SMAPHALEPSASHAASAAPREATPPGLAPRPDGPRTLDDLALLRPDALAALYQTATTPTVPALEGHLVGRMLAVPVLPAWMAGLLRRFAGWTRFPWRGKSFSTTDESSGEGINRVFGD